MASSLDDVTLKTLLYYVSWRIKERHTSDEIGDLNALKDGIALNLLIEQVFGPGIIKWEKSAKSEKDQKKNLTVALRFLEGTSTDTCKLRPNDLWNGHKNTYPLLMNIFKADIKRQFTTTFPERNDPKDAYKALVQWANELLKPDLQVHNLTDYWTSGKALGALVEALKPGVLPTWRTWSEGVGSDTANLKTAMSKAEEIGIKQWMRPEDMSSKKMHESRNALYLFQLLSSSPSSDQFESVRRTRRHPEEDRNASSRESNFYLSVVSPNPNNNVEVVELPYNPSSSGDQASNLRTLRARGVSFHEPNHGRHHDSHRRSTLGESNVRNDKRHTFQVFSGDRSNMPRTTHNRHSFSDNHLESFPGTEHAFRRSKCLEVGPPLASMRSGHQNSQESCQDIRHEINHDSGTLPKLRIDSNDSLHLGAIRYSSVPSYNNDPKTPPPRPTRKSCAYPQDPPCSPEEIGFGQVAGSRWESASLCQTGDQRQQRWYDNTSFPSHLNTQVSTTNGIAEDDDWGYETIDDDLRNIPFGVANNEADFWRLIPRKERMKFTTSKAINEKSIHGELERIKTLAEGNYYDVYEARVSNSLLGYSVAAAKSFKGVSMTLQDAVNCLAEIQKMAHLKNEHVMELKWVMFVSGKPVMLLPLQENGNSQNYLLQHKNDIPKKVMRMIDVDIAKGMMYLHRDARIVHRNLCASNCLLDRKLRVRICGFFFARETVNQPDYIKVCNRLHDDGWRTHAPEILGLADGNKSYNTMTDVWSYGILLCGSYRNGLRVFNDVPKPERLREHLKNGHIPEKPKEMPYAVYDVVQECLKLVPAERPTFADLVDKYEQGASLFQGSNALHTQSTGSVHQHYTNDPPIDKTLENTDTSL